MTKGKNQAGVTLVELAVVVAIIGILAAVAVPSFVNLMPRIRLSNATRTLSNEIAMLRMSAIAKSLDAQVRFNPGADSYSLAKSIAGAPFVTTSVASFADLEGLTWLDGSTTGPVLAVTLQSNGTTSVPLQRQALIATLATKDGRIKKRVLIWSSGRIQSQKWAGGNTWVED